MIWLLLALALHPPLLETQGLPGEEIELSMLVVGNEPVRITATPPLALEHKATLNGAHHLTLRARITPHAPPGDHTAYIYVEPAREDNILLARAATVRVAVQQPATTTRIIPTHHSRAGLWAALAGAITTLGVGVGIILYRRR